MRAQLLTLTFWVAFLFPAVAQVAISTSFESSQNYSAGTIHNQNGWRVNNGNGTVTSTTVKTGSQALTLSAANTALFVEFVPYSGMVPGLQTEVYADFWVKPVAFLTKGIAIGGYDQYAGSSKRVFVVEFTENNLIKAYTGSTGTNIGAWVANQWVRISVKVDFLTEKYKVAIDGVVLSTDFNFREAYTPTASGTRVAGVKELHSLRFNHTADTQVATSEAVVDDLYLGTNPIPDVNFGGASTIRTITVTQPAFGTITLAPARATYNVGDQVTATLTLPQGYQNNGWTGSLTGTALVQTFTVTSNMAISANTGINPTNPPALYNVSVTQPANGTITLSPAAANGQYYAGTSVTATITPESCYQFTGWTGALSGTQTSQTFTVTANASLGATIAVNTTPSVKRVVASVADFRSALAAMNPGDTLEVANGTYNLGSANITRSGCQQRPIVIRARNQGLAVLSGNTTLTFESVQHIRLEGFAVRSASVGTGIKLLNSSRITIARNAFALTETSSCNWIYIGDTFGSTAPLKSGGNVMEYNSFDGKTMTGKYVVFDGTATQQSQHDTIRYNLFKNNGPRAVNEQESIRVGVSGLSPSSGFTVIEHNLFQACDGDPEIVSIKSCDNIVRFNTFQRSLGTVTLRQGRRNVVEGNYFFGEGKTGTFNGSTIGCGGIRVYGKDHLIFNNYMQGLTGSRFDAGITITNGDVDNSTTSLSSHNLPENVTIAFNTLVNNRSNIEIGFTNNGGYPLAPLNCVLANNVVVENTSAIVLSYGASSLAGVAFANNLMYPTGTASVGIPATAAQIRTINPLLMQPSCVGPNCTQSLAYSVLRLAPQSPAIDAATGTFSFVSRDFENQSRTVLKDVGADEFNGSGVVNQGPLDERHVGPDAVAYRYEVAYPVVSAAASANLGQNISLYPNPATADFTVYFSSAPANGTVLRVFTATGKLLKVVPAGPKPPFTVSVESLPAGMYYVRIEEPGKTARTRPLVVIK